MSKFVGAQAEIRPKPRRLWPRRLAIGAAIAVAVLAVVGLVAGPIGRRVAEKQLGELLGRRVSIARVRVNPFALSLTVEGFQIYERDGATPFVGFSRLYVNAEIASAFRRAPVVKEIALEALRVHVVRERATADAWGDVGAAYNFSDIVARLAAAPKSPEPPQPPDAAAPRFSLNNLHVDDAAVVFDDRPTGDHHEVSALSVGVPFVSTLPVYVDSFVQPGLRVRVDGTPFEIAGRTKPFKDSLETVLELRLGALELPKYVPFVPVRLPIALQSGRLGLALDVAFVRPRADAPKLTVKGTVTLDALDVEERHPTGTQPLAKLAHFAVTLGESDVTAQRLHVEKVLVSGLDVHVRRRRDGSLNLEHLAPEGSPHEPAARAQRAEPQPHAAPEPSPLRFVVDAFDLESTALHFRDESVTPPFEAQVEDVTVAVRALSNAPGATAKVRASLHAVPGGRLHDEGTLSLAPLAAAGKVTLDDVEPGRFAPYYANLIAFDVGSGRVRLGAGYHFEQESAHTTLRLEEAFVELTDLALRRRGARDDFFKLGTLAVRGTKLDLGARKIEVAALETRDARIRAARDARGVIDLTTLVPPPRAVPEKAAAVPSAAPAASEAPWTVTVARFDLDRWGARFEDHAVSPAAVLTVDPIALHVTNLSTAPGATLGLDLRLGVNKTGSIKIAGTATLPPVAANLRFDLRGLEILPFQPYFHDQESLLVTGGALALRGQAQVKLPVTGQPKVELTTDVDVSDVATVDRANNEPLVAWKAFHVGALHVATAPLEVAIGSVSLTDFQARLVMSPDGRFNLQDAFAAPGSAPAAKPVAAADAKKPETPEAAPTPVTIGQVTLQGGKVTFTDRSIHPAYTADLTELAGRVSGLSSTPGTTAAIDVRGSVNRSGVLTIVGSANPLAKDLSLDVQVALRDFELPPTSPYAGHYAGYVISKGKLALSLDYKIAGRKLDAKNRLVLDQFTFGEKVDSPDATKLPVRLAVALLKDRHGVIDLEMPIAGSLDDPEFKVGRAVLKVLGNLVVKAATAPFSLIASAFGGGDELQHIEFPAGRSTLDDAAGKRLAALSKALNERPGLSFEIAGGADGKRDREGLRRFLYERKLKAVKLTSLVQEGAAVPSLDALSIDAAERPTLIGAAYKAEKFPKPTNGLGFEKSLPPEEMEKLMLVNTRVEDDELRALALRRATAVQSALSKSAPGAASRLYLVTPRLGAGGVELDLKKD